MKNEVHTAESALSLLLKLYEEMESQGNETQFVTAFSALEERFGSETLLESIFKDDIAL